MSKFSDAGLVIGGAIASAFIASQLGPKAIPNNPYAPAAVAGALGIGVLILAKGNTTTMLGLGVIAAGGLITYGTARAQIAATSGTPVANAAVSAPAVATTTPQMTSGWRLADVQRMMPHSYPAHF